MDDFFKNEGIFAEEVKLDQRFTNNQVTDLSFRSVGVGSNMDTPTIMKQEININGEICERAVPYNAADQYGSTLKSGNNMMTVYVKDDHLNTQGLNTFQSFRMAPHQLPKPTVTPKPRGRMSSYAYFIKYCHEEHKRDHPGEAILFLEFGKECANRWKNMSEEEKSTYREMADNDKLRYDAEMRDYMTKLNEEQKKFYQIAGKDVGKVNCVFPGNDLMRKKRTHMKDPNAPKKYLSPFFWFCKEERNNLRAMNPSFRLGELSKELGRKWNNCSLEVKQKYEAMSERDKARYEEELMIYNRRDQNAPVMQIVE